MLKKFNIYIYTHIIILKKKKKIGGGPLPPSQCAAPSLLDGIDSRSSHEYMLNLLANKTEYMLFSIQKLICVTMCITFTPNGQS